ncbi:MAG: PASTA domain-containing protein [Bacteroidales bacterium]|nr:PASTA domain-containing protein [Bacteroidales bacterium]
MKKKLSSSRLIKTLALMSGIIVLVFLLLKWWLFHYTNHGEQIAVPDFKGLDFMFAQQLATQKKLVLYINDTIYSETIKPGAIAEHTPKHGDMVKENRTIYLTMNATGPILVLMPKAYDVSLRQAQHTLEQSGLQLGRIEYKPDIADNYVFEQRYKNKIIEPGTQIPKGSKISLVVGKGSMDSHVIIPSIIGLTYQQALLALDSLGINYNPIFSENIYETAEDSLNAIVWKQSPNAVNNAEMQLSETLDFWMHSISSNSLIE